MEIWTCEMCDQENVRVFKDNDLDMWLCLNDWMSFNTTMETI